MHKVNIMIIRLFFISLISTFAFTQCSTTIILPSTFDGKQIEFGSGGGFVGTVTSYILLENGMLFKKEGFSEAVSRISTIDANIAAQIFNNYGSLGLAKINVDNPGNVYKFIIFSNGEINHKQVWSNNSTEKNLNLFYDNLKGLVNLDSK